MQTSLQKKRNEFAKSIRRKQINKIIHQKRIKFFNLHQQQISEDDMIAHFDLTNNPQFSNQNLKNNPFILVDILLAKFQNLIRVSFKDNQISLKIDEKLSAPPQSQFQLQDVPLPKQYPFRLQTILYDSLTSDIFSNPGKYKNLDKKIQEQIITFWIQFLKRNKYTETSCQKQYHLAIINLLELFVCEIESPDLRENILSWVKGPQSLTLIFNCLQGHFMNLHKYTRIYEIILKGFKHKEVEKRMEAVDVLLKCIKMSDYDDIATLLQCKPQLFESLLNFFKDEQIKNNLYNNKEHLNSLKKAAYCLTLFLSTYDENIFDCLQGGAGFIGALLICEQDPDLIKQGIQIFQIIANIQDQEYSRRALQFLIYNPSIIETKVWDKLGRSYAIVRHQDVQIQKAFISFIRSFLANAEFLQIMSLSRQFQLPNGQTLVDIMITMFLENSDVLILRNILSSFQSILYYFQEKSEDVMEMDNWQNQERNNPVDAIQGRLIVAKIQASEMKKKLQEIYHNQGSHQELRAQVGFLLQIMDQYREKS